VHNAAGYDARHLKANVLTLKSEKDIAPHTSYDLAEVVVIEGGGWADLELVRMLKHNARRVIIRLHAAPEFLYFERPGTCTTKYIREARELGAEIACVSEELAWILGATFLPINYPLGQPGYTYAGGPKNFDVGCFGSIRPLKNHVGSLLALGAARGHIKQPNVFFHINSTRIEGTGHILTELDALARELDITLVKHDWLETEHFKSEVIPSMDLGIFGSFAESFCLTAADFVAAGVPSVMTSHIPWAEGCATDTASLTGAIVRAIEDPAWIASQNLKRLREYGGKAALAWQTALRKGDHVTTR
jgi:hypothetical protein